MHVRTDGLTDRQNDELLAIVDRMRSANQNGCGAATDRGGEKMAMADARATANQGNTLGIPRPSDEVTLENVDEVMRYQSWGPDQVAAGDIVREALTAGVRAILRVVPRCPNRTKAINHIIDARMDANAGISFRGRF